ncbi:MAG: VOC family protein [Novosphingobium sp.]|nr:VOC family protein [Novosphingobium sp.]
MSLHGFFQNAYVTHDLDRAIDLCAGTTGIGDFAAADFELQLRTPSGDRPIQLRVATAWIGALQIELIQPVAGHVDPYVGGLPADTGDFTPRFHHVAVRRDDPEALADEIARMGLPIVFETGGSGISSTFVDAGKRMGHPIEFVCANPDGWAMLGWPNSN